MSHNASSTTANPTTDIVPTLTTPKETNAPFTAKTARKAGNELDKVLRAEPPHTTEESERKARVENNLRSTTSMTEQH
jgi:hypothetical protein